MQKININKYRSKVLKVLAEQNFIIGNIEKKIIEERISNGRRYFFMVGKRKEDGKVVERFVKIPENNTKKLLEPFARQIEFAEYIKNKTDLNTRGIIDFNYNLKKGIPFVVMETFPKKHSKIGFIEGNRGSELLGPREAKNVVKDLHKFHNIKFSSLPPKLKKILKKRVGGLDYIKKSVINRALNKKVLPLDAKNEKQEVFYKLLERRLGIKDFKKKIFEIFKKLEPIVQKESNKGTFIIHGDLAPNNLYVFDNGQVEFLDLEWVGTLDNKVVAMVFDFGNMRTRAWKNKPFREELDKELLKIYKAKNQEETGKAIICLSILRSNIKFSKSFENYDWDKQKTKEETMRRKVAEEEIKKIWEFNF